MQRSRRAITSDTGRIIFGALFIAAIFLAGGIAFSQRTAIREAARRFQEPPLPAEEASPFPLPAEERESEARPFEETIPPPLPEVPETSLPDIPREKLLAVPFTPQAPHANWDMPYQEACEEASVIMVAAYYAREQGVIDSDEADRRIRDIVRFQQDRYGFYEDTSATETARLFEEYYPDFTADVLPVRGPEDIKRFIAMGVPVILPADGKALPNPHFRNGGPVYHMLVVRGYTDDRFITNDPGTKFGERFLYTYDGLLNAVHDWNNGDVANGAPVMIVIRPRS